MLDITYRQHYRNLNYISEQIHFSDYKEYLQYIYNSCMASGQIPETVEVVRQQPRGKPFDYSFNTQEGKWNFFICFFVTLYIPFGGRDFII